MRIFMIAPRMLAERYPDNLNMAESYGPYVGINPNPIDRFPDKWNMGVAYEPYSVREPLQGERFPDMSGGANDLY